MPYGVNNAGMRCSDTNDDGTEVHTHIIFLGGLSPGATTVHIKRYFDKFGRIIDCSIVQKGRSPGIGFVHFDANAAVERVVSQGDMHSVGGKMVEVRKAVPLSKVGPVALSGGASDRRRHSPLAGSRSFREEFLASRGREPGIGNPGKRKKSSSSSSSSSASRRRRKRRKQERSKARRSSSSSSSSVVITKGGDRAAAALALRQEAASTNPEVEKAKQEALERLIALKNLEPEARMKEWRLLLREWHPDKNPERVEVATAVFQFLQKGKAMVESD